MKTYRQHSCERTHRTFHAAAKCIWRRAAWVAGDGPYASVAYCRVPTVQLHLTRHAAEVAKQLIDKSACGGHCRGPSGHELIELTRDVADPRCSNCGQPLDPAAIAGGHTTHPLCDRSTP